MFIDFRNRRAFSLLEIVLVVAILFLFVLLLIPALHPGKPIALSPDATPTPEATPAPPATVAPAIAPANPGRLSLPPSAPAPSAPVPPGKSEAEKAAEAGPVLEK